MMSIDFIRKAYEEEVMTKYDGLEIFMMNVGNADCFLVIRYYPEGRKHVVLIDGGKKSDAEGVVNKIKGLGITHIDFVVNTHPHDDHAGGLVDIIQDTSLTFGELWMHASWTHIDASAIRAELGRNSAKWVLEKFEKSLATQMDVFKACNNRNITVYEPFAGRSIGPFQIIGPSTEFYVNCLAEFNNSASIKQWNDYLQTRSTESLLMSQAESVQSEGELGDSTSPENESSVVMSMEYAGQTFLFCGDAGCKAFEDISDRNQAAKLKNVHWLHAPHHGSRRNMWPELIEWMNPDTVYMSCGGTNQKHPSRKLVKHLKDRCKSNVYASYYPKASEWTWICSARGTTPERNTRPVSALFDAN